MIYKIWQKKIVQQGKRLKQDLVKKIKAHLPKWRSGNTLSRIVRAVFEKPQTKKLLGFSLSIVMVVSGPLSPFFRNPVQAQTTQEIITPPEKVLTTQTTFQKPTEGVISQGYHWYHQAVDIAFNDGWQVKPVASGKVIENNYQFFGYGNYVVIDHGQGTLSLYAHLSTIKVTKDQEVTKDTILGMVGSTGRSTGPHLHLEIMENGEKLNPSTLIENL